MRFVAWALAVGLCGCGAGSIRAVTVDDLERVRASGVAKEGAELAPETYARAERQRDLARAAHASGDETGSTLHAEAAMATYAHSIVQARLVRAASDRVDAQKALDEAQTQEQSLETARAKLDEEAADLERRAQLARDRLLPAPSGPSTEREAARLAAARSLAIEARLLCGAAGLIAADASALAPTAEAAQKLDAQLKDEVRPAPIDEAARVRASCLDVLTRARRAAHGDDGRADALLAELSATGAWAPGRDERGVVISLRDVFRGGQLTDSGASRLTELGRVAAAHPDFPVQLVVHDAQGLGPKSDLDLRRADSSVQALIAGGAAHEHLKAELAGAHAPVVDPSDPRTRARNERLDVVFVAPGR